MTVSLAGGWRALLTASLSLAAAACGGRNPEATNALAASLIFDNASPDMRDALTSPIDYRITDDNFARWQEAENNLEELPRGATETVRRYGRTAIERAVRRLESSPSARQAIESAGLSVRDFVLETIALAQAKEAAETGKSTSPTPILAENYQFVKQYGSRVVRSESVYAQPEAPAATLDMQVDTRELEAAEMRMQQEAMEAEHASEMQSQRDLEALQERVQREIDAALERYDRTRLRFHLDRRSPDSLPQTR